MRCSDFLNTYSDFRDQRIADIRLRSRIVRHLSRCPRCARYHEVINQGVARLRSAEETEPSARMRTALRIRLASSALNPPLFPVPVRLVGSMVVAAAVATLLIQAVASSHGDRELPPPPSRPMPMVRLNPAPPFVIFADLASGSWLERTTAFEAGRLDRGPIRHLDIAVSEEPE